MSRQKDLERIAEALAAGAEAIRPYQSGSVSFLRKHERGDPLTEADLAADAALRECLPADGEGWLSEESRDDRTRLNRHRVWIVDPIDGTREFVEGIPEWCISVGLVEDGAPVAGGVYNPASDELVMGAVGLGVTYNRQPVTITERTTLDDSIVLASRSETKRGEWERYADAPFVVRPCGSVAYKLALVAAGKADATWTLVPKSEWDVAGGAALVRAAGGVVIHADGTPPRFNQSEPRFPDLLASSMTLMEEIGAELGLGAAFPSFALDV